MLMPTMKHPCLYVYILNLFVRASWMCGPGNGVHYRAKAKILVGTRQPDFDETDIHASGPFERPLLANDTRLRTIISTEVIFADPRLDSNFRKTIEPCRESLLNLIELVHQQWGDQFVIKILHAYAPASTPGRHLLHLEGRALDLKLVPSPKQGTSSIESDDYAVHENEITLQRLAGLAYFRAGFSYVEYKKSKRNFIHVSCRKESNPAPDYSRCFPESAFVRDERNNKILMKDLKVGTKVLTIDSNGKFVYSDVVMMMHRQPFEKVNDYVKLTMECGSQIVLSSYHLIYTKESDHVFAKNVRMNDSVLVYQQINNEYMTSKVIEINYISGYGAYAPLTMEGTIIVNDVYASCYALFPSHTVSHFVFGLWRFIYNHIPTFLSITSEKSGYHWYPNIFREAINSLSLFPYRF